MRVVTVEEMRELERLTFESGTSEDELQRRAGIAVARAITDLGIGAAVVTAFVGPGNNGRDAWIAVDALVQSGWRGALYLAPRHALTDAELRTFLRHGGQVMWHPETNAALGVEAALSQTTIVIDGLLGIGARGAPRPPLDAIIDALNDARRNGVVSHVVSVDVPSGLDADDGATPGVVVKADLTVALGGAKRGLISPAATPSVGRLVLADIGVVDGPPSAPIILDPEAVRGLLEPPAPGAHKGVFGRLLVVAGSERYVGAAHLTCSAAVRAGAGIVTLAAPRWLRATLVPRLAEATYLPLPDAGPAGDAQGSIDAIAGEIAAFDALAVGPGLSLDGAVTDFVERLLRIAGERRLPTLIDADALNVLARTPGWQEWVGPNAVLTPHLGELARLTNGVNVTSETPWTLAGQLGSEWGVTLVVKGAVTAIGSPLATWVHARPNPALATAGTGDVLTGIVGGLLARGLPPTAAARLGIWVHGAAGALASSTYAAGGLAASDLLPHIPTALAQTLPR